MGWKDCHRRFSLSMRFRGEFCLLLTFRTFSKVGRCWLRLLKDTSIVYPGMNSKDCDDSIKRDRGMQQDDSGASNMGTKVSGP